MRPHRGKEKLGGFIPYQKADIKRIYGGGEKISSDPTDLLLFFSEGMGESVNKDSFLTHLPSSKERTVL
jgi:hypothetical protein